MSYGFSAVASVSHQSTLAISVILMTADPGNLIKGAITITIVITTTLTTPASNNPATTHCFIVFLPEPYATTYTTTSTTVSNTTATVSTIHMYDAPTFLFAIAKQKLRAQMLKILPSMSSAPLRARLPSATTGWVVQ